MLRVQAEAEGGSQRIPAGYGLRGLGSKVTPTLTAEG